MKKFLAFVISLCVLTSCEKVPVGERIKDPSAGGANPTGYQQQAVLIEEFTGITCNNCPKAATEIKKLIAAFPNRVNAIAIHASNFAIPNPPDYPSDFRTNAGTFIYDEATPFGVPSGMLNRLDYNTASSAKPFGSFADITAEILLKDTADIRVTAGSTVDSTNTSTLTVSFTNQKELVDGLDLYWMAVVTENKIVAPQKMPDNTKNTSYEHSFVLRESYNGNFGEPLNHGSGLNTTTVVTKTLSVSPDWDPKNCTVVAFVYDKNSGEVIQSFTTSLTQ